MANPSIVTAAILLATIGAASAAVTPYQNDLAGFNGAAGSPGVAIDFDSLAGNIAGSTISGVTFTSPTGNTLDVVAGASTFTPAGFAGVIDADTNRLFPTSGPNVLSPGGLSLDPGPAITQADDLLLDFATPLSAFGVDILLQSFDVVPLVQFEVFGGPFFDLVAFGSLTGVGGGGGGAPGGSVFLGFVSDAASTDIRRIRFFDFDGDAQFPDANLGYDSIRIVEAAAVPEASPLAILCVGLLAAWSLRARSKAKG